MNAAEGTSAEQELPQFAVLIYAEDSAHDPGQEGEAVAVCDAHAEDLARSGGMTHAWALTPREQARSLRSSGTIVGPFKPEGPVVAGFYILRAPDLEAALAMARTNPAIAAGGGLEVEVGDCRNGRDCRRGGADDGGCRLCEDC